MLDDFRIIEIEGMGPGPFAGMTLADLGAEVIVVHRDVPPLPGGTGRSLLDRGKKSVVLDLKDERDINTLKRLIGTADGLIEGFRPGVMERIGLGPDTVLELRPRLVYGRMTGWGQDGPMAQLAGHDLNYIALSGALAYGSPEDDPPSVPPTLVGDIGGGAMYLVAGMLAGLLRAQKSGIGTVVDAAIVDGSAHMMNLLVGAQSIGLVGRTRGTGPLDGSPWSRCYRCADGRWLAVQCIEAKFYDEFVEKLGVGNQDEFRQDRDPKSWPSLARRIGEVIATRALDEWSSIFEGSDACVAPVLDPRHAAAHPHLASRGTWVEVDGQLQARAAPRFDADTPPEPGRPPLRGEHTEEVLASLGAE